MPRDEPVLLWIGSINLPSAMQNRLLSLLDLQGNPVEHLTKARLESRLMNVRFPAAIASPLYWAGGDVLELGAILQTYGYSGPLRALTAPIPDAELVRREVLTICPDLDFDLVEVGQGELRPSQPPISGC